MTRAEHIQWCKDRALAAVDSGDVAGGYASIASDIGKHPEAEGHVAIELGMMLLMGGHLDSAEKMREFINGIN